MDLNKYLIKEEKVTTANLDFLPQTDLSFISDLKSKIFETILPLQNKNKIDSEALRFIDRVYNNEIKAILDDRFNLDITFNIKDSGDIFINSIYPNLIPDAIFKYIDSESGFFTDGLFKLSEDDIKKKCREYLKEVGKMMKDATIGIDYENMYLLSKKPLPIEIDIDYKIVKDYFLTADDIVAYILREIGVVYSLIDNLDKLTTTTSNISEQYFIFTKEEAVSKKKIKLVTEKTLDYKIESRDTIGIVSELAYAMIKRFTDMSNRLYKIKDDVMSFLNAFSIGDLYINAKRKVLQKDILSNDKYFEEFRSIAIRLMITILLMSLIFVLTPIMFFLISNLLIAIALINIIRLIILAIKYFVFRLVLVFKSDNDERNLNERVVLEELYKLKLDTIKIIRTTKNEKLKNRYTKYLDRIEKIIKVLDSVYEFSKKDWVKDDLTKTFEDKINTLINNELYVYSDKINNLIK